MLAKQQQKKNNKTTRINKPTERCDSFRKKDKKIKNKGERRDTHSTNWKVAKVQEGPNMMHPISLLFCKQRNGAVRLQCTGIHAPDTPWCGNGRLNMALLVKLGVLGQPLVGIKHVF